MKHFLIAILWLSSNHSIAQSADQKVIRQIMGEQETVWNRGDLEAFMDHSS
ncbi:MAG: hypothetical protein ACKVT2_00560 [Saprospiraceae bacterium]